MSTRNIKGVLSRLSIAQNATKPVETKQKSWAMPPRGDAAHVKPLAGGGANTRRNERVESVKKNRS